MSEELKGNGHCETLVVDDEPTEGVSGSASAVLCARAPVGLLAELTHRCPLQCSYCSNPIELERVNKELSTEMWCSVMRQAGEMGILQVHLSGGEPTARKDLEAIISAASEAGLYSNLITAAVTLNRARLEDLARRGLDHVQISFQDVDAENAERIGAYPEGFWIFESTEFLRKLKKALRLEYRCRLVACFAVAERPVRKDRTSPVGYGFDQPLAECFVEPGENELIVLERIFFRVQPMALPERLDCLADLHNTPPGLMGLR